MDVYVLQHSYEIGDFEETKFIGVYSSKENATQVVKRYMLLPGFKDYPESCFYIARYQVDKDNWTEGFIKWQAADGEGNSN